MGKKKPVKPVFPPGVTAHFPGVEEGYAHGYVGRRGLVYESGVGWRKATDKDPTGHRDIDAGIQYRGVNFGVFPEPTGVVPYSDDATIDDFDDMHDELGQKDVRHLVAFPPDVRTPVEQLLGTMKRVMGYSYSSPGAWGNSARDAAAKSNAAVSHVCEGATMARGISFPEVLQKLGEFMRDTGNIATAMAKSITAQWFMAKRDYVPSHYSTYGLECGRVGSFVAIAYAAAPRYSPAVGDTVAQEVMRGGFMVSIAGAGDEFEITTYMLTPEPVSMRHVAGNATTYVLHAAAKAMRVMLVHKNATSHNDVHHVHAGQTYKLTLTMTNLTGGTVPRYMAEMLLEE